MELCEPAVFFKCSTSVNKKKIKHSGTGCKKFAMRNLARLNIMKDPLHMYCVSEISIECSHNH